MNELNINLFGHWRQCFPIPTRLICTCRLVGVSHSQGPKLCTASSLPFLWPSLSPGYLLNAPSVSSLSFYIINSACDKNFFDRFPSQWSKFRDLITTCTELWRLALSPQLWYCRWMTWPGCFLEGRLFWNYYDSYLKVFQMPAIEIGLWN